MTATAFLVDVIIECVYYYYYNYYYSIYIVPKNMLTPLAALQ